MKNSKLLLTVILIEIIVALQIPHAYSSTLTITVATSKPYYLIEEDIIIFGNLTYDDSPIQDWLVALEVQDPYHTLVITRTLQTDTNGAYNLTFKLPTNSKLGTYNAYVSSGYKGETGTNNTTFEIIPMRDIAVTNLTPSKTVVGQDYSMPINVTTENQGDLTETFNVTVYANTTSITSQEITLSAGNSTTITFTWNTTGFTKSNYTISAIADTLPLETDTTDNTLIDGKVYVGIPGDVTPTYGQVDMKDIGKVVKAFGSTPVHPNWNTNCDVNGDEKVDMKDIGITVKHFGQTIP